MKQLVVVLLLLFAVSCCTGKPRIVIAAGTSFRDWDWRLDMPHFTFNCSATAHLYECATGSTHPSATREAHVVLFQADELQRKRVSTIPQKQPHQLFIAYSLENPGPFLDYFAKWEPYRNGVFDYLGMVAPYPSDAYPYAVPSTQKTMRIVYDHPNLGRFPVLSRQFIAKKMRLLQDDATPWISVMISYSAEWRVDLLRRTMDAFGDEVRSMGPVLNNYQLPASQGRFAADWNGEKQKVIQDYLFHFAWENSWVPGFVTEKIFDCFVAGTVPIYVGTEDVYDMVPCDMSAHPCFIDYSHFQRNPVLLYNYVSYLVQHPAEYMKYFEWLNHPVSPKYQRLYQRYIENNAFCRMCDAYYTGKLADAD